MFRRCKHERTRCIHGDEGWARMKVYTLRWWKGSVVRRQACIDCGAALDRDPLCLDGGPCISTPPAGGES
jgi:hypothetical protein